MKKIFTMDVLNNKKPVDDEATEYLFNNLDSIAKRIGKRVIKKYGEYYVYNLIGIMMSAPELFEQDDELMKNALWIVTEFVNSIWKELCTKRVYEDMHKLMIKAYNECLEEMKKSE